MNKYKKLAFILLFLFSFLSPCNSTQMPDLGEKADTQTLKIYALNDFRVSFMYDGNQRQILFIKVGQILKTF